VSERGVLEVVRVGCAGQLLSRACSRFALVGDQVGDRLREDSERRKLVRKEEAGISPLNERESYVQVVNRFQQNSRGEFIPFRRKSLIDFLAPATPVASLPAKE